MQQNIAEYITIMLQNITIVAASNVLGEQDVLWGFDEGRIYDLVIINIFIITIIFIVIWLLPSSSSSCYHSHKGDKT